MGGFEGGDEGGFWDEEALFNPINATTKTKTPQREKYTHLKDTNAIYELCFVASNPQTFRISSDANKSVDFENIYNTYTALIKYTNDSDIEEFFNTHEVVFERVLSPKEPFEILSAPLLFLEKTKEVCSLVLTQRELIEIAQES